MEFEKRFIDTPLQLADRQLNGTAAVYYNGSPGTEYRLADNVVERFTPEALQDWLGSNPQVYAYFNHDRSKMLAKTPDSLKVWGDSFGLHYRANLPDVSYANDLKKLIDAGLIAGSSVSFLPQKVRWVKEQGQEVRMIERAIVDEVSPVYRPAYVATAAAMRERQDWAEFELLERAIERLKEIGLNIA